MKINLGFKEAGKRIWLLAPLLLLLPLVARAGTSTVYFFNRFYPEDSQGYYWYQGPGGCDVTWHVVASGVPDGRYRIYVSCSNGSVLLQDFDIVGGVVQQNGVVERYNQYANTSNGYARTYAITTEVFDTVSTSPAVAAATSGVLINTKYVISEAPSPALTPGSAALSVYLGDAANHVAAPPDSGQTKKCDDNTGCLQGPMASYSIHLMLASLHLEDTPVSYAPPRGPRVNFVLAYNQREANQPSSFPFSNLGPKWSSNWLSYVTDNPTDSSADASVYVRGGGAEVYAGFNSGTQSYAADPQSMAVLVRTSGLGYEKRFPDGSKEVFTQSDGSTSYPRRIFLTSVVDPAGNTTTLNYDGSLRLTSITDPLGQATTLSYDLAGDTLKITKVTDPFGRYATFDYTSGQLTRITDPVGIQSQFTYASGTDFIDTLTTPYGTTSFTTGSTGNTSRWLEATDPTGGKERVEYDDASSGYWWFDDVPAGFDTTNLQYQNTFYWDKKAMAEAPGDITKAHIYHWLTTTDGKVSGVKHSEKKALEARVWYSYPSQPDSSQLGPSAQPTSISRLLDDETMQVSQFEYNALGNLTKETDPAGRVFSYTHAGNGIDLTEKRQTRGSNNELLASYTYNSQHEPLTVTDAAGETSTFTYNAYGQVHTRTNAKSETTTYAYDRDQDSDGISDGYPLSMTGPVSGATTTYTYDSAKRIQTATDSDGYVLTYGYDNIDRTTSVTYPDTTTQQFDYTKYVNGASTAAMTLDLGASKDRRGRWTYREYDANRQLTKITDPLGHSTLFDWCSCGALGSITDANSHTTSFIRDVQGRVTSKTFADSKSITYTYEGNTSRLKSITDAKNQKTTYAYNVDDTPSTISYTDTSGAALTPPTPGVSFTYDPDYRRVATMTDGTGTTTYSYNAITGSASPGAGQLYSIDGPLANDTTIFTYDQLGRELNHSINSVSASQTYDSLGRVDSATNPLGSFSNTYVSNSGRLASVTYPNGQETDYSYFSNSGDKRLQTLQSKTSSAANISKFDYTYDADGEIMSLIRQLGSANGVKWSNATSSMGDLADQLTTVAERDVVTSSLLNSYSFGYDDAANRTSDGGSSYTVNSVNQIANTGYTYDDNGNLTADPDRTYEWDAANRLIAINSLATAERTEFAYDGLGRRVQIVEKSNAGAGISFLVQPSDTSYASFSGSSILPGGNYTLTLQGLNPDGGDNTIFLDAIALNGTLVPNGGFETPDLGAGGYAYTPDGATWIFVGNAGMSNNGSGFTGSNPDAPEGSQVGVVQTDGSISQSFTLTGGSYTLSLEAAQRGNYQSSYQQVEVTLSTQASITSTKNFVWIGNTIAEERDENNTVTRRFYPQGEQISGDSYYYTRGHLGSVRELVDSSGNVRARYDYDPYGNRTKLSGDLDAEFGYTGHYYHSPSNLYLALYRAYDPTIGKWISRDPIEEAGGINLYGYVGNDPIRLLDPSGLLTVLWVRYPAGVTIDAAGAHPDGGHILLDVNGHRLDYTPMPGSPTDFLEDRANLEEYERIVLPLTPAQEIIAERQIDNLKCRNSRWDMGEKRYCSTSVADVINRTGFTQEPVNGLSPFTVVNSLTGRGSSEDPRFNPLSLFRP